ncbi:hypothetical protein M413DRAFT_26451 [Hebeloma cylindrosporum]|uniref:DUF202 domain-containing protein n=1 Tax=Hebeloma cylindrosporum TaxID=76867 RepID=A0A0C3C312_HEBCY|nr:hypothetical protein M413DRAFT_26451 [Hebeloma cylindrosporum h7]
MQVVGHIPQDISSSWPSHPTESTPLLAGSPSSKPSRSKERVFTAWNNAPQNRIRGKVHLTKHRKKSSTLRSLPSLEWVMDLEGSHDHRHSNSGQVSPPHRRFSNPRHPSPVTINSLDDIHPGPTDTKTCLTQQNVPTVSFSPFSSQPISLCLQNSGSVARDHLASERTFLAYVRTSLAIVSAGPMAPPLIFIHLIVYVHSSPGSTLLCLIAPESGRTPAPCLYRPLGATAVAIGLAVLFIGVARYFTIQAALTKGYFPVARLATGFIAIVLSVLVTLTFGILLAGKLEAKR